MAERDAILERLDRLISEVETIADRLFVVALPVYLAIIAIIGAGVLKLVLWLGSGGESK